MRPMTEDDAFLGMPVPKEKVFRITFATRYRRETHPAGEWITADGYALIVANSDDAARAKADAVFGELMWSNIYDHLDVEHGRFNPEGQYYPDGVLAVFFAEEA